MKKDWSLDQAILPKEFLINVKSELSVHHPDFSILIRK